MSKFIGGRNVVELAATLNRCKANNWIPILDYAREGSRNKTDVVGYMKNLKQLEGRSPTYALKLSSFAPFKPFDMMDYTISNLRDSGAKAIFLDAERVSQAQQETDIYNRLLSKHNKDGTLLYKTYQMYKKTAYEQLMNDVQCIPNLGVKLVRGAYYEKDASTGALFDTINATDTAYNSAMITLLTKYPSTPLLIATHNKASIDLACAIRTLPQQPLWFAQLLGMKDTLSLALANSPNTRVYKYVPYGSMNEMMPYLVRRLYENRELIKHMM